MKRVILAASLIAGIIAISACTKVNPVTDAINNAKIELAPNGGGCHGDSLCPNDSLCNICDSSHHNHYHYGGGCGDTIGGGCGHGGGCGGDTINGGGNGGHGGGNGGGHGHGGHGGGC